MRNCNIKDRKLARKGGHWTEWAWREVLVLRELLEKERPLAVVATSACPQITTWQEGTS